MNIPKEIIYPLEVLFVLIEQLEFRVSKGLGKQSRGGIAVDDVKITFGAKCIKNAVLDETQVYKPG